MSALVPPFDVHDLAQGGRLRLVRHFVPASATETTMRALEDELCFEERTILLFGKEVIQPRLIAWAGDRTYRYSGASLAPRAWSAQSLALLRRVNDALAIAAPEAPPFNHLLANLYRDGADGMGMHSDDESELGPAPWIGSVSLGETRRFVVAEKKRKGGASPLERLSFDLPPGSLLLMEPPMQERYRHGIPKTKLPKGARLNLTFRAVLPPKR